MKVADVMKKIEESVAKDGESMVKKVKAVFMFEFKGGEKWLLDLKNGKGILLVYVLPKIFILMPIS